MVNIHKYPIIYRVLYIPGACLGFLPSTGGRVVLGRVPGTTTSVHQLTDLPLRFELGDEYIELKGDVLRDMLGGSTAAEPRSVLKWMRGCLLKMREQKHNGGIVELVLKQFTSRIFTY